MWLSFGAKYIIWSLHLAVLSISECVSHGLSRLQNFSSLCLLQMRILWNVLQGMCSLWTIPFHRPPLLSPCPRGVGWISCCGRGWLFVFPNVLTWVSKAEGFQNLVCRVHGIVWVSLMWTKGVGLGGSHWANQLKAV